jgi:RimJ/RimL family protein N-acetyltransferase
MVQARTGQVRRLLVFLGGGDPGNFTSLVIQAIRDSGLGERLDLDVVIGVANPHRQTIAGLCNELPRARLHIQTSKMAELMAAADLMIGAAGATSWERCCLGLPAILVSLANNQRDNGRQIAARRAAVYLGDAVDTDGVRLAAILSTLTSRPSLVRRIGKRAFEVTEGCGANLLALILHGESIQLRRARAADCERVWCWRNDLRIRRTAFDPNPIDMDRHRRWYEDVLENPKQMLLIGTILGQDIGVLRYDTEEETAEISVYLDPGLHGLGLGAMLIAAGNRWLENEASFVKVVVARIRPENRASLRAFGEAGFQSDGADRLILQWRRNGGSDSAARFNI